MDFQCTISKEINCSSVGLHTGRKVKMKIKPAEVDTGIIFRRRDLPDFPEVHARFDNVCDTMLATSLGTNGTRVATVEHLLSAFNGVGVDNAVVEIDSFEVPIMDGSALPFVQLLKEVGTHAQTKKKKILVIKKPVIVREGDARASFLPADEFKITYEIDFPHEVIGKQSYSMTFSDESYEKHISPARTFGFLKEVEHLQAKGLGLGGSLDNAIVLDEKRVINKNGLRFPDEFVRHKILDAVGDLFLLGMPIIGHFIAYKSGHRLNNLLLKELVRRKDCWQIINGDGSHETVALETPSSKVLDSLQV